MKNKSSIVALIVVAIIAISGLFLPQGKVVVEKITENLGVASGPKIQSEFLTVNGVETWYVSQRFNTASTTRCALRAPLHATSTLSNDGVVKAATTTDYTLTIAKAATQYATTTLIRELAVTDNGQIAVPTASTTVTVLVDTNRTFKPGEWLVVSAAGATATAFDSGICTAIFNVGI